MIARSTLLPLAVLRSKIISTGSPGDEGMTVRKVKVRRVGGGEEEGLEKKHKNPLISRNR